MGDLRARQNIKQGDVRERKTEQLFQVEPLGTTRSQNDRKEPVVQISGKKLVEGGMSKSRGPW